VGARKGFTGRPLWGHAAAPYLFPPPPRATWLSSTQVFVHCYDRRRLAAPADLHEHTLFPSAGLRFFFPPPRSPMFPPDSLQA